MTGPKALLITLVMAAGLITIALSLRGPYQRAAIDYWRSQLLAASDEDLDNRIREATEQDEIGLAALIESLDVPRENLAQAVKNKLLDQLARWQSLDDAESAKRFAQLAARLGKCSEGFGPQGRAAARELALKMLAWRPAHDPGDRGAIVSACETILTLSQPAPPQSQAPTTFASLPPQAATSESLADAEPQLERATVEMARLPGGGLAIDSFPAAPRLASEDSDASAAPQLLPDGNPLRELAAGSDDKSGAFANAALSAGDAGAQPIRAMSLSEEVDGSQEAGASQAPSPGELESMKETDVMRLLQDASPQNAAAARKELQRRNFGEVQIDLATRLFTADSQVRRDLARALPALRSVDPTPWLLWLARDDDAEVRLTAISLMATVNDPRLLAEIERMASSDSDPRIRRCAEQLRQVK